jgi:hypothetical protein
VTPCFQDLEEKGMEKEEEEEEDSSEEEKESPNKKITTNFLNC